ncbi:MAG: hypothetical protein KQI62_02150 [Deltaproteobacteria bacterium]|nr:hypothetical protein [Deltaproteobacteria bacterium]
MSKAALEHVGETLPWPSPVPAGLLGLLHKWAEWRVAQAAPRPVKMPDPNLTYKITGRGVVASRRFMCPRQEPARLEEFNLAFWGMAPRERFWILAFMELEQELWKENSPILRGSLTLLDVTWEQFKTEIVGALKSLAKQARQRGVL